MTATECLTAARADVGPRHAMRESPVGEAMRDPARIDEILSRVRELWLRNPDYRLTQLIVNLVRPSQPCPEVFSFEDSVLLKALEKALQKQSTGSGQ